MSLRRLAAAIGTSVALTPAHGGGPPVAAAEAASPDPGSSIVFTRILGGSGDDVARAVATARDGSTYVTGDTSSPDFPATASPYPDAGSAGRRAFVAKLDAGGRLVYATLLGAPGVSSGRGIAVDREGRAFIAGATNATSFPVTRGARQRSYGGGPSDAFVAALDARGRMRWSTFLGDTHYDEANAIALDPTGRPVVAGRTVSPQFPHVGRLQPPVAGGAFVAKLDRAGAQLVFSSVFGGPDRGNHGNTAFGVAVDAAGRTYATGVTNAASFPVTRALQPALAGAGDAFALKIDAAATRLVYATYLGGSADDSGRAIAADGAGNAYVTGMTRSPRQGPAATADAFVAKLGPDGRALAYDARFGGASMDAGAAIAVGAGRRAVVTGSTGSWDFPLVAPSGTPGAAAAAQAPDTRLAAGLPGGAFVARLSGDGASLGFSTRLAGEATDAGLGTAVDRFGAIAVAGARGPDAFVTVLAPSPRVQLRRQLVPRGRDAGVRRLLRLGHADLPFAANAAGALRISWYAGTGRVAAGRARFAAAGRDDVELRLTPSGRRTLRRDARVRVTARGVFSPVDAPRTRAVTTFVLER